MRFQPGQSGNLKGRPKRSLNLPDIRKLLAPHAPKFIENLLELVNHSDPRVQLEALRIGMPYLWGKPQESIEHSGQNTGVPTVVVLHEDGNGDHVFDSKLGYSVPTESAETPALVERSVKSIDEAEAKLSPRTDVFEGEAPGDSHEVPAPEPIQPAAALEPTMVPLTIPNGWGAGSPGCRIVWAKKEPGPGEALRRRLGHERD